MSKMDNLIGRRFGRLVVSFAGRGDNGGIVWVSECDCGKQSVARGPDLKYGKVKSCGCLLRESTIKRNKDGITHGLSRTYVGSSWQSMMTRCYNKRHKDYAAYGGMGIFACVFLRSSPVNLKSLIGDRERGLSLDRINNFGNYTCGQCPECLRSGWQMNVRWATQTVQGRNQRTNNIISIDGATKCIQEWSEASGVSCSCIRKRIKKGLTGQAIILRTHGLNDDRQKK